MISFSKKKEQVSYLRDERERNAENVGFQLRNDLGPYGREFARYVLENTSWDERTLEGVLVEEWDGAVPETFLGHEEVSRELMSVLHLFLEFAVSESLETEELDRSGIRLRYYVEPYYEDSSAVLVVDTETKTLLCRKFVKTYRFDKEKVEGFLESLVEEISSNLPLLKRRGATEEVAESGE